MPVSFAELYARAAERKGGTQALEHALPVPKSRDDLVAIPDARWLAEMTKRVFQAGFNWSVVETKWPGFEAAFDGFDVILGKFSEVIDHRHRRRAQRAGGVGHHGDAELVET